MRGEGPPTKTRTDWGTEISPGSLEIWPTKHPTGRRHTPPFASMPPAGAMASSSAWSELGVCVELVECLTDRLHFREPSAIQAASIPHALAGRDVVALARTGSGKTAAFALPILQHMLDAVSAGPSLTKKIVRRHHPSCAFALCMAPTRELAIQIKEQFEAIGATIGVRCVALVGGVDIAAQAVALARRPLHVVVATPGRIVDHLRTTKGFSIRHIAHLVLDEADRLLSLDFEEELHEIIRACGDVGATTSGSQQPRRITQLFSATMTHNVAKLQRAALVDPVRVEVGRQATTANQGGEDASNAAGTANAAAETTFDMPEHLVQSFLFVPMKDKEAYLTCLLDELGVGRGRRAGSTADGAAPSAAAPASGEMRSVLVFVRTCDGARRTCFLLRNLGLSACHLSGKMDQPKRIQALNQFKGGQRQVLVATDVASRGLDIPSVDAVVNFDVPQTAKDYVHRVGRTARAGRSGAAVTVVSQYDVEAYQKVERDLGIRLSKHDLGRTSGGEKAAVGAMHERVAEASRLAAHQVREEDNSKKGRKKRKNMASAGGDDDYDAVEALARGGARRVR